MRSVLRLVLAACLVAGLLNPLPAAAATPLGTVIVAEDAHLSGTPAAVGANVFTADTLHTNPGGVLRVKFGSTQLYLTSASAATLGQQMSPLRVTVTQGKIGFSSNAGQQFEIETPVGSLRGVNGQRAFGEVAILSPRKIQVSAFHGSLVMAGSGVERTLTEGNTYHITFVPDAQPGNADSAGADPQPAAPKPGLRSNTGTLVIDAVIIGAMAGFGYFLWHHYTESDPVPSSANVTP